MMLNSKILSGFAILLFCLLISAQADGQNCAAGKVIDATTGQPLYGVTITQSGGAGTTSNQQGDFKFCGFSGKHTELTFSYVGFKSISVKVASGDNDLKILLSQDVALLDEFVVSASRSGTDIRNTPVRIHRMNPQDIEKLPVQTADEILKAVPGIYYSRSFGILSTKATVTMRGMSGKEAGRILILIDGIPVNKSDGGGFDWNMLDPSVVQGIEVIKGPGSAIYGGNAMGGIINILTRKPSWKLNLNASIDYGTFNTLAGRINAGGSLKLKNPDWNATWNFNTFYRKSDGYITQLEADVKANPYIIKSNLKEGGAGLRAEMSYKNQHTFGITSNYYNDRRGTGEKVFQPEGNITDHDSYSLSMFYKGRAGKVKVVSSVYFQNEDYKKVNEYLKDDYTWYDVLSVRRDYGWLTSFTREAGEYQRITAGVDIKAGSVDASDQYYTSTDIVYNAGKMNTWSVFVQDELMLLEDKLSILAGLRYDRAKFYDGAFYIEMPTTETRFMEIYQNNAMAAHVKEAISPRLSAHYRWNNNMRVYAGYSRGFRPAVLDDMCRSGRIKGGFKVASPELRPEYLNNFEIGADLKPFREGLLQNLKIEMSAFWSIGKDFQYYVTNGQTIDMGFGERPVLIRANISEAEIKGAELSLNYEFNKHFNLYAGFAKADAKILNYSKIALQDTIDLSGKTMTEVPDVIVNAGVAFQHRIVNASLNFRYTGEAYLNDQNIKDDLFGSDKYPAYSTLDLRFWREFYRSWRLALNIQNLTDVKIYDSKYNVGPGRFITLSVGYSLKN